MSNQPIKRVPYAIADYRRLRMDNGYYVDKTRFIPLLEAAPYYLFFIRPRRFGKTLWLSVLQHYYDINLKDEFTTLFADTFIGAQPTADHNNYLIMLFNFSLVNPDVRLVEASFEEHGRLVLDIFLDRYKTFFSEPELQDIATAPDTAARLQRIFYQCHKKGLKTYLFIDEYDNFANTILSTQGQQAYHDLTHGAGFFRYFFNLLKGATTGQIAGLTRLFVTGVSPITMDDVSSGFNIGANISLDAHFNEMVGFTEVEVQTMLTYYRDVGALPLPVADCLALMQTWYNHYCFSRRAQTSMYNSDMVLYFILQAISEQDIPHQMIDPNVRIDYTKLRYLINVDKRLNGNFSQLQEIVEKGETVSRVNSSFPLERLHERVNFVSLLYYFGLLTFAGEREGDPLLRIPNFTIKDLLYGYIRDAFRDVNVFQVDVWQFEQLMRAMAYRGEWQPVFEFLTEQIRQQTSVRDYLHGEKMVQGFLLAYLNITDYFLIWSERELSGGFVDLYLEPFLTRYREMGFGYLLELEYIARNEFNDKKLQEKIKEAQTQLARYANDPRLQKVASQVTIKKLILIYSGWELVYWAET